MDASRVIESGTQPEKRSFIQRHWDAGHVMDIAWLVSIVSIASFVEWNYFDLYATIKPEWWKCCGENKGFGSSSYLSAAFGLNIVLAKWEAFKKSLADVENQLTETFRDELKKVGKTYTLVDDESDEMAIIKRLCKSSISRIRKKNLFRWQRSRRWAILFSIVTISLLFCQVTSGVWGAVFLYPLLFTSWSMMRSKSRITSTVRAKMANFREVLLAQTETQAAREIQEAMGSQGIFSEKQSTVEKVEEDHTPPTRRSASNKAKPKAAKKAATKSAPRRKRGT